jgi:hypothetical protein
MNLTGKLPSTLMDDKPFFSRNTLKSNIDSTGSTFKPSYPKGELTINVPVSVENNKKLASTLRSEIERTVIRVIKEHV